MKEVNQELEGDESRRWCSTCEHWDEDCRCEPEEEEDLQG